jgi:hypothetical protein
MAKGMSATPTGHATVEEAIAAGRQVITAATRHTVHTKTLAVVSDDQQRIMWAAASDGWETDYRPGSPPEMR